MKIILVVGPSGSGKDTLLRSAKAYFQSSNKLGFSRRYITRPPDENEDNFYIDPEGFKLLEQSSFFISTWRAHNNHYGISQNSLKGDNGIHAMLCSVSRSVISDFEKSYPQTTTIQISANEAILQKRLQKRARENQEEIQKRLIRAKQPVRSKELIIFDNSAPLELSVENFTLLLEKLIPTHDKNSVINKVD